MKLLIVEDDPNLSLLWGSVFSGRGHEVVVSDNAAEARKILLNGSVDLILLDLYLGRDSGLSVAAMAAYSHPSCKVIVVTGSSAFAYGELFELSSNIASVLRKPVDIEHLVAVCDHLTADQAAPAALESVIAQRRIELKTK